MTLECEAGKWAWGHVLGEVKGISGFIPGQGLENIILFAFKRVIARVRGRAINLSHLEFSCRSFS